MSFKLPIIKPQGFWARCLLIGGVALVIAAAAICRIPGRGGPEEMTRPAAPPVAMVVPEQREKASPSGSELPPPAMAAPPTLSRDMFEPPSLLPELSLTATILSPRGRVAMINGRPLVVGDRIHGARVVRIEEASVLLRASGRSLELNVCPVREN